jgi:hypothetical protein
MARCGICGEPWDNENFHDEIESRLQDGRLTLPIIGQYEYPITARPGEVKPRYDQDAYVAAYDALREEFRQKGCATFSWATHALTVEPMYPDARRELLHELLGNDWDGIDAIEEDMGEW